MSESGPRTLAGSVRALVAWWRSRSDLLQDSVLAAVFLIAVFLIATFTPPLRASGLALRGSPERPINWFTFYLLLVVCCGAGSWVRSRAAAEAQRRRQNVQLAMAAERARIARELHDVVTHHVTAMVAQADAAQFVLTDAPDRAADGLGAVSGTGRRALAEKGRPGPLAAGTRLAVYRVVQEALTNAMKHAPGQPVMAEVRYRDDDITIDVTNDGPVVPAFTAGRGLTGLRERVRHAGGELHATARPDGGFIVQARMPRHPAGLAHSRPERL